MAVRKEIRQKMRERQIHLKELDDLAIKEDLGIFLKAELRGVVMQGKYKGMTGIEALAKLYKGIILGEINPTKAQQSLILRTMDQYVGRGQVAAEQKDAADAGAPKVLYVGGKQEPKTIPAQPVPVLEAENVSRDTERPQGE
jgi:hypothetical protein